MVEGYTGRPGSGKTSTMVARAWKAKERGRRILANIPLVDNRKRRTREYWFFGRLSISPADERTYGKPWSDGLVTSIEEIIHADNALILLDEVHMWLGSDAWKSIGFEVRQFLAQQRKEGVDIWWTAQSAGRVFNVIRELTATSWSCQRYGPLTQLIGTDPETKEAMGKRWLMQSPEVWALYNTTFKVGDGRGTAGTLGTNERYARQEAARDDAPGGAPRRLPAYAVLDRAEELGGRVVYGHSSELRQWWQHHDLGRPVAVSPLARSAEAAPAAGAGQVAALDPDRERVYWELFLRDLSAKSNPVAGARDRVGVIG